MAAADAEARAARAALVCVVALTSALVVDLVRAAYLGRAIVGWKLALVCLGGASAGGLAACATRNGARARLLARDGAPAPALGEHAPAVLVEVGGVA